MKSNWILNNLNLHKLLIETRKMLVKIDIPNISHHITGGQDNKYYINIKLGYLYSIYCKAALFMVRIGLILASVTCISSVVYTKYEGPYCLQKYEGPYCLQKYEVWREATSGLEETQR